MSVYRFGVGHYIKAHEMCSISWKAVLFHDDINYNIMYC